MSNRRDVESFIRQLKHYPTADTARKSARRSEQKYTHRQALQSVQSQITSRKHTGKHMPTSVRVLRSTIQESSASLHLELQKK